MDFRKKADDAQKELKQHWLSYVVFTVIAGTTIWQAVSYLQKETYEWKLNRAEREKDALKVQLEALRVPPQTIAEPKQVITKRFTPSEQRSQSLPAQRVEHARIGPTVAPMSLDLGKPKSGEVTNRVEFELSLKNDAKDKAIKAADAAKKSAEVALGAVRDVGQDATGNRTSPVKNEDSGSTSQRTTFNRRVAFPKAGAIQAYGKVPFVGAKNVACPASANVARDSDLILSFVLIDESLPNRATPIILKISKKRAPANDLWIDEQHFEWQDDINRLQVRATYEPGKYEISFGFHLKQDLKQESVPYYSKTCIVNVQER